MQKLKEQLKIKYEIEKQNKRKKTRPQNKHNTRLKEYSETTSQ